MAEISVKINIERLENGAYLAISDDVPGLVAQDVIRKLIGFYLERGDELLFQLPHHRLE
jgi:hypothetical protein